MEEWPRHVLEVQQHGGGPTPVRGTQSFVHVLHWCWRHPSVTALEVLWRWIFGCFALWLLGTQGELILKSATGGRTDLRSLGLDQLTITDPMGAAARFATAFGLLLPPLMRVALWVVPLLLAVWLFVSTMGRTLVLRRVDPAMRPQSLIAGWLTLGSLQLIRVVALGSSLLLWATLIWWAGQTAISAPLAAGGQPALVEYFTIVIVGTLLLFSLWAIVSWVFSLAPLIAMRQRLGVVASLRAAGVRGPVRLKLVEINLVMGIVKIALIVLAMVFSACPLPFESVMTPQFLLNWTLVVAVLYLLASDFFHVVRLVAYLELWRVYNPPDPARETTLA